MKFNKNWIIPTFTMVCKPDSANKSKSMQIIAIRERGFLVALKSVEGKVNLRDNNNKVIQITQVSGSRHKSNLSINSFSR